MRRVFTLLTLVLALAACGVSPRAPSAPDPALEALYQQLKAAPDAAASARIEARIYQHWGRSGSPTVDVLLDRADKAEKRGEAELAVRLLEQASDLAPSFAEPWRRRAGIAYDAQDYAGALAAIQETLNREPRHFVALGGMGLIREQLGQERQALDAFRAAIAVNPHYEVALRGVQRLEPKVDGRDA